MLFRSDDSAAIFTVAAFITASSIYLMIGWRALRMKSPQVARFENLPFATATPSAHDSDAAKPAA